MSRQLTNSIHIALLRPGVKLDGTYPLSVRGRKSGKIHTIPVRLVEKGGQHWLITTYGQVNWVRNARAAGQVTLSHGRISETVTIVELGPDESAPVLKDYLKQVSFVRPYFNVMPESTLDTFVVEAPRHPVFRIIGPATSSSEQ